MPYRQGSVVLAADFFKNGDRPYFVLSNDERPFHGQNYTVAVMSTTPRESAITVQPGPDIAEGRLNKTRYINPWALHLLADGDIRRRVAQLTGSKVEKVCEEASTYIRFK